MIFYADEKVSNQGENCENESQNNKKEGFSNDFWNLGARRERVYAKPDFEGRSPDVTEIIDDGAAADREQKNYTFAEKIPPRGEFLQKSGRSRVVKTINGTRIVANSYRGRTPHVEHGFSSAARERAQGGGINCPERSYTPDGSLISRIDVRTWATDTEFYGRFASDAMQSHNRKASFTGNTKPEEVPYFSYVPQYSHMNLRQIEYYGFIRESVKKGQFPPCDLSYVLLYIYEIINLPGVIPAPEGAELLASIWCGYRKMHPRLDGYLCEWLPDYCMIGGVPLPDVVIKILPEIVPKAQFKEFYFNLKCGGPVSTAENVVKNELSYIMAKTLIESTSDYDYRTSKYYSGNEEKYEEQIPCAVSMVMHDGRLSKRGIFSMDRVYKLTRDSYCGAIASSGIKKRLDIEFCSFTRRADARRGVTAIVKYCENKLRAVLGIKAKLGTDEVSPEDRAVIDRYFAPLLPTDAKKIKEDRYMPENYLKNYEAESSGFDFDAAFEIEKSSWNSTAILTGDENLMDEGISEPEEDITLPGEISFDDMLREEDSAPTMPSVNTSGDDEPLRKGAESALSGRFREYCREAGLHEGDLADRINTVFIEIIGDVVLLDQGSGFELIEDYREDVISWLQ